MTCIVGVIDKDKVWIGGDSAGVGGYDITVRKDPKIFKVGDFLIGCTSSFRMIQLLRFSLNPPKRHPDKEAYEYMCTEFINEVRRCFKDGGFNEFHNSAEHGGTFLVGYNGRLFCVGGDYQVGESHDNYMAVGCGEAYALGAAKVLFDYTKENNAFNVINEALQAAVHFSAGVRPPFVIESI